MAMDTWCFFELGEETYGITIHRLVEMVQLGKVSPLPDSRPYVRGITNLRGRIVQVLDLREMLGLPSLRSELDELVQLLRDREHDHIEWVQALRSTLETGCEFTKSMDADHCAFGQWKASFHTENAVLKMQLDRFDHPHRSLHAAAKEVLDACRSGNKDHAHDLINQLEAGELATLRGLFEDTRRMLVEELREILVVLNVGGKAAGLDEDLPQIGRAHV